MVYDPPLYLLWRFSVTKNRNHEHECDGVDMSNFCVALVKLAQHHLQYHEEDTLVDACNNIFRHFLYDQGELNDAIDLTLSLIDHCEQEDESPFIDRRIG